MPSQSLSVPENTFVIDAVDSAIPSTRPSAMALAPRTLTMNTGSSPWIISEETSMKRLTKPSAQTALGIAFRRSTAGDDPGLRLSGTRKTVCDWAA